jgi:CheY-like chemotaxis protein
MILLDLNTPILDGCQFLDEFIRIKERKKDKHIYIITSSIDPSNLERSKAYNNANNFIVKQITLETLKMLLHESVE